MSVRVGSYRFVNRIGIRLCRFAHFWMFLVVVERCVLASVLVNLVNI